MLYVLCACVHTVCGLHSGGGDCTIKTRLQLCEGDRDPIAKSNKTRRISLQMLGLDMTAPSITAPHVRGRGMTMTQSKSRSHGRIYIGLFHSSTSLTPLLLPSLPPSLLPRPHLFVLADASLSFFLSLFSCFAPSPFLVSWR